MRLSRSLLTLFALSTPLAAEAHGEQVLLLPVGQVAALGLLVFVSAAFSCPKYVTAMSAVLALAVSLAIWFVPGNYIPESIRWSGFGNFVLGSLPPFLAGLSAQAVWLALRRRDSSGPV